METDEVVTTPSSDMLLDPLAQQLNSHVVSWRLWHGIVVVLVTMCFFVTVGSRENPDAICLLETKADWGMGSQLARRFRFDSFFEVASFSYGILLWIVRTHTEKSLIFSFAYVQPSSGSKEMFWDEFFGRYEWFRSELGKGPCIKRLLQFRERMSDCNLVDPGCSGGMFTWVRKKNGRVIERLDRALWNEEDVLAFPDGKVFTLPRLCSDHNPIMFSSHSSLTPNVGRCSSF